MHDTSLYPNFNSGYVYSIKCIFLRLLKAIESRRIAQWDSAYILSNPVRVVCNGIDINVIGHYTLEWRIIPDVLYQIASANII